MGQAAITASQGTYSQLQSVGLTSSTVGVTAMIGQNDIAGEIFTIANAEAFIKFAKSTSWISVVSFWSSNRDVNNPSGPLYASSQISQSNNQFGSIFAQFL